MVSFKSGFEKSAGVGIYSLCLALAYLVFCLPIFSQTNSGRVVGPPDAVFFNGKVITVDSNFSVQQAFALKGDEFVAVGTNAKIRTLASKNTRLIDLRGHAVIPGLTDNHDHVYDSAKILLRGIDVVGLTSLPEMLDRIREAVAKAKPGETVFTSAGSRVQPALTKKDLDEISGTVPIVAVRRRRGAALLNTAALRLAGITRETQTFAGSPVPKDANGEPTGANPPNYPAGIILLDKVLPPMTDEEEEDLILKAQQQRNALGLTSVRDLSLFPEAMRAYYRVWRKGKLTIRVSMGLDLPDVANIKQALNTWGVASDFGDTWLRLDSISEDPGPESEGLTAKQFSEVAIEANRHGWRLAPHTVSDQDLAMALDAYEAADRDSSIREKRWVLEHIPFVTPSQMDRIAKLGVVVSAQYAAYNGNLDEAIRTVGRERAERQPPVRELLDHHLIVSTGSDYIGGAAETDNPLIPFYFYVTRKTKDGRVVGPEEKISREEALRVSTINYAYTTFEEKVKGSIEPGKLADFLILSDDVLTVPDDKILSIHPLATYVGGREVFSTRNAIR